VYIIVVGLVLDVLRSLGSEIDERSEADGPVVEDAGHDALVPPATEGVRP
jgi:multicomponent Na+:H+ antiporter subunit A